MRLVTRTFILGSCLVGLSVDASSVPASEPNFQAVVESDWERQEQRNARSIEDPRAVRDALASAQRLLVAMSEEFQSLDLQAERWALARCADRVGAVEKLDEEARRQLYGDIRTITRGLVVKNPFVAGRPLAFMKRRRFICQMLHEYIGYYYNYDGLHGGGLYVLEEPGISLKTRDLIGDRLPKGSYATPALSCNGQTIYFAFCELSDAERTASPPAIIAASRRGGRPPGTQLLRDESDLLPYLGRRRRRQQPATTDQRL